MRAIAIALGASILAAACAPAVGTDAGWVVAIDSTTLTDVRGFTIRVRGGEERVYRVGALELDGGAFPATHLREHMALAQPIAIAFDEVGSDRVATRIVDAPWLKP